MRKFLFYLTFLCCLFSLPTLAAEPSAAKQQTSFGSVELVSCTKGLRTNAPNYLAVAIFPDEEWHIQQAHFSPTTSDNSPIQLFTPFKQPFDTEFIYPISSSVLQKTETPTTFIVEGDVTACHENSCTTEPIRLSLTLQQTKIPIATPDCSIISFALANTPIPMDMRTLKGWAIPLSNGKTQITLDFEKNPRTIQIYDSDKHPLSLEMHLHQKRVQILWPTQQKNIQFYARTKHHFYEIELPLLSPNTHIPQFSFALFWSVLVASFCFVLLSAFPIYWARITKDPLSSFKKQALHIIPLTPICACIALLILSFLGQLPLAAFPFSKTWTLIFMGLGILLAPAHPFLAIFFTLIAPRPYLTDITTHLEQILFIVFSTCIILITFALQFFFAKQIFTTLQNPKNKSPIWWIVRVPWIFLMIYTALDL